MNDVKARKFERLRELYEIGGMTEVTRGVRDYCYDHTPIPVREQYHERRTDNLERWSFMQPYLSEYESILDIGCAEGYFTINAAKEGLVALGIDNNVDRLTNAREKSEGIEHCGFMQWKLTHENIDRLPSFDATLLLTVHHHWERQYDLNVAEAMFATVLAKCDLLIYEPPGDRPLVKDLSRTLDPARSEAFYADRLGALYGDTIEIIDSTMVHYRDRGAADRQDPLFIIDASSFDEEGVY